MPEGKPLTLEQAQAMQKEMIAGYSDPDFQTKLRAAVAAADGDVKKIAAAKRETFQDVQYKVLPNWGFEASPKGVMGSTVEYNPHNFDPIIAQGNYEMNYWTQPENFGHMSFEEYVEEGRKAMEEAARLAEFAAEKKQQGAPAQVLQKGSVKQAMLKRLKERGDKAATVQRVDAEGAAAGVAPADMVEDINATYEQGRSLSERGEFAQADPILRQAYQLFDEVCGEGHLYTIGCANTLGFNLHEEGRYTEAEPILQIAVAGFTRICGKNGTKTVAAMNNYALCLQGQGKNTEAGKMFEEILQIAQQTGQTNVKNIISLWSNLGECMRLDGQYQKAEDMFLRAYRRMAYENGPECIECALFANNLAVNCRDQNKNAQAMSYYARAIKIMTKHYGPDNPKTKLVQKNMNELTTDKNITQLMIPDHMMLEARAAPDQFFNPVPVQAMAYKSHCGFSAEGIRAFDKLMLPVQGAAIQ